MNSDTDIQKALESVVLFKVDCEKGDGKELAKEFKISGYPTFVLLNKDGQVIDRWMGYTKEYFLNNFPDAITDLATIEEKQARLSSKPDAHTAAVLARYAGAMDQYKESVAYYQQANRIKTDPTINYDYEIFGNMFEGAAKEQFTYEELASAADFALKSSQKPLRTYMIASNMVPVAQKGDRKADVVKYLQAGLDATTNSDDAEIVKAHKSLMIDFSLLVKGDTATAVEYKKAIMPEGWMEDAGQLNGFAWWCFENNANLKEAESLSRKSVELAKAGKEKAMNLDTLAEIVHARGNTIEAVDLSKQACKEDPASKYYPSQVERFQKAMAEKK